MHFLAVLRQALTQHHHMHTLQAIISHLLFPLVGKMPKGQIGGLLLLFSLHASAQAERMFYYMDTNTKLLTKISMRNDPAKMNWIIPCDGSIYPWINDKKYEWGYIKNDIPQGKDEIKIETSVRRIIMGYNIVEEYTIENRSKVPIDLSQLAICTPWNAQYMEFDSVMAKRCDIEVKLKCEGSKATYVKATRRNNKPPHVGLVLTKGDLSGYYTGDCTDLSNNSQCGIMYVVPEKKKLKPKKKYVIEWHIFSFKSDKEFDKHL